MSPENRIMNTFARLGAWFGGSRPYVSSGPGETIILILDRSASMAEQCGGTDKLTAAKEAAIALVRARQDMRHER